MNKIRKGDTVVVISGKDKGRQGTVLKVDGDKVTVENVNKAKKHQKPNPQRQVPAAIVDKAMPLHISKVAIFNVAAKKADGAFQGVFGFDDTDVYKSIEAAAYSLGQKADPALDRQLDEVIAKIADAQEPDGYLYTSGQIGKTAEKPTDGKTIFTTTCAGCHTLADAGTAGTVGPNLDDAKPPKSLVVDRVTNGKNQMPSFKDSLDSAQIEAVAEYVSSAAGK